MKCGKCGTVLRLQGTEEDLEKFLDRDGFMCPGRHAELGSPRDYLELRETVDIDQTYEWKPKPGRKYVDIHGIEGLKHMGFGMFEDPETGRVYDYEPDEKGKRHYYEV